MIKPENQLVVLGETNFRSQRWRFGIKQDDRRRHMYVVGSTGMGKTEFMKNMAIQDIEAGRGVAYIDPHGDASDDLLDHIPPERIKDVIYFDPGDLSHPIAFNVMEKVDFEFRHLVASGLLGAFKKIFGELTVNIIAVGEISGNLGNNLDRLALTLKKRQALQRKVVSASVYPVFIIIATLVITVMLTVFVFPKIIPVFKSVNYQLPWTTRFLIFISDLARNHGFLIVLGAGALVAGFLLLLRVKEIHFWHSKMLLRIPFIGRMIQTYNTTNICRTMGLLLDSGVTVVRAFHITSNTTANAVYKKQLNKIADKITQGEIISANMNPDSGLFPLMVSQMIMVGESTGKLSETFSYLADIYEEEMDEFTKNLSTTIEPLLLIFMGAMVGFIAISIITPIYGITQHLNPR